MSKNRFIIVDENKKPMAWSGDQLCYCTDETWQDKPHPVAIYTESTARKLIEKTMAFRKFYNTSSERYYLMPVKPIP